MIAGVFYACKAIAYGGQKPELLLHLCRLLIRIGELELASDLLKSNDLETGLIYFLADEELTGLHYRFGSLENMQPLIDSCLFLPQQEKIKGKVRIELQDLNSAGTQILYPDGWGPYRINRVDGKLQVQKIDVSPSHKEQHKSPSDIVFGDHRMTLSTKWIRSLTPFQFSQSLSN